ncbi:glycosyltransferase [Ramlibacter sp.]|uniref:glycosyltransferase family protein n=1 Tax=Ramlibacter sp. TaxID=1917967 RepID=UPI00262E8F70|nr:glycosyltransferase [Ramlibacter sp.]MDB5956228.1 glycosyltransferase [Ramlibacter sp.]
MTRVLVYSHDPHGLGHTRRMLDVAEHLVGQMPGVAILLLTDAPALDTAPVPQQVDFMRLPSVLRLRGGESGRPTPGHEEDASLRMRSNLILMAALDFAPDLVIVDHEPLGFADELAATFDMLARRPEPPKMALLLRDLPHTPEQAMAQWEAMGWHASVARHFNRILVMGEREVFDLAEEYAFPLASKRLLEYCGPIERSPEPGARLAARARFGLSQHERVVLVAAGLGDHGTGVVTAYLQGLQLGTHRWQTLLALGPELEPDQRESLIQLAARAPHVICLDMGNDGASGLHAADAVLATGGSGTACELLTLGKPAVIVPWTERLAEQWIRAERVQRSGLLRALHPRLLTAGTLMESLAAALADARASRRTPALPPTGLARLQHAISGLLAQRARSAATPYGSVRRRPPVATESDTSPLGAALASLGRSLGLQPFIRSRAAGRRAGGVA